MSVIEVTDAAFETEVLKADRPVLVYFWAPWCGPCRLVSPSVDLAANTWGDRLKVLKMEVDPNPETVKQYKVEGIPTLKLFRDAAVVASHEGAIGQQKFIRWLESNLE